MELSVETLKCESCGAALDVRENAQTVRCGVCGHQVAATDRQTSRAATDPFVGPLLRLYCRVMIVLLVYVLSTGPMYWALYAAYNASGSSFLAKLYYPLVWACQRSDLICTWFDWYVGLWVY